jgi:diguanylate cyclase (GGDEF)-like protein
MRDIGAQRRAAKSLEHLALHDGLTGALGRTLFMERLGRALTGRRRAGKLVAVLLVDLDGFKAVNDSLGQQAGDRLLVEIAGRIRLMIRPEDALARISGDEFTVLCEEIDDESDALAVAARLKTAVEAPLSIEGRQLRPGVSVGVALARVGHDKPDTVLSDANSAMARAKQHRHEGPVLFDEDLRTAAGGRAQLESELRAAIQGDELVLHYQPQVSLLDGMPMGVEALVRWNHPTRGLMQPSDFIPFAEETGLIVPLGERVLEMACIQARAWSEMRPGEPPMTMSVNLSPAQLLSPTLQGVVESALESSGLEPYFLCLEITERTLMVDGPTSAAALAALGGLGVRLAIDDFGTGYSSLSYLRLLPVDSLKVDAIFVEGLGRRRDDKAIVAAVIQMAHALGMGVVAEGVESERQVSELRDLGCDLAQGFRFARPTPAGDLRDVIERPRPLAGAQPAGE